MYMTLTMMARQQPPCRGRLNPVCWSHRHRRPGVSGRRPSRVAAASVRDAEASAADPLRGCGGVSAHHHGGCTRQETAAGGGSDAGSRACRQEAARGARCVPDPCVCACPGCTYCDDRGHAPARGTECGPEATRCSCNSQGCGRLAGSCTPRCNDVSILGYCCYPKMTVRNPAILFS